MRVIGHDILSDVQWMCNDSNMGSVKLFEYHWIENKERYH